MLQTQMQETQAFNAKCTKNNKVQKVKYKTLTKQYRNHRKHTADRDTTKDKERLTQYM